MVNNTRVIYIDMPVTIKAYTMPDEMGFYTIYLNSKLSIEQNELSYLHELKHINNGDYDNKGNVNLIEIFAHGF